MTDSDSTKDTELDLQPELAGGAAPGAEGGDETSGDGQWVWQFAAPPPPPSFGAMFFSGQANKDHYRFFACALLVVVGCLLPWGPVDSAVPLTGEDGVTAPLAIEVPDVLGFETPAGAISLLIGLWLLYAACHGVYTGRHKILPVFLMIEPAIVTWLRTLDAWGRLEGDDSLQKIQDLFVIAGTGVMLTLIGSTFVAGGFLMLVIKVYAKKDDKGAARRSGRGKKDDAAKGKRGGKDKGKDKKKGKQAKDDAKSADKSGAGIAATSEADAGELEELTELAELTPDDEGGDAGPSAGSRGGSRRSGGSRGRRGRRR